jgi:two-component SAPR family response regulator
LALEAENLEAARTSFQSALRLKRFEPDFYFALADVYSALGDELEAEDLRQSAEEVVAGNAAIYQPSSQKLRVIDSSNILNDSSAGTTIRFR